MFHQEPDATSIHCTNKKSIFREIRSLNRYVTTIIIWFLPFEVKRLTACLLSNNAMNFQTVFHKRIFMCILGYTNLLCKRLTTNSCLPVWLSRKQTFLPIRLFRLHLNSYGISNNVFISAKEKENLVSPENTQKCFKLFLSNGRQILKILRNFQQILRRNG